MSASQSTASPAPTRELGALAPLAVRLGCSARPSWRSARIATPYHCAARRSRLLPGCCGARRTLGCLSSHSGRQRFGGCWWADRNRSLVGARWRIGRPRGPRPDAGGVTHGSRCPISGVGRVRGSGGSALALGPTAGAVLASLALIAHAIWDVIHYRRNAVVPQSFAEACMFLDVPLGVTIIVLTLAGLS